MSRLESFIRRMSAQRDWIDFAADKLAESGVPGPVLELGLGNGRTYDHLRERFPERDIFVFEREVRAHRDCIPEPPFLIEGEIFELLPVAQKRIGTPAVLANIDMFTGHMELDLPIIEFLNVHLPPLMADSAMVISDRELSLPGWLLFDPPSGVPEGRYFGHVRGM